MEQGDSISTASDAQAHAEVRWDFDRSCRKVPAGSADSDLYDCAQQLAVFSKLEVSLLIAREGGERCIIRRIKPRWIQPRSAPPDRPRLAGQVP